MNPDQQNTKKRNTPSPTVKQLRVAIRSLDVEQVTQLLADGASVDATTVGRGFTALMLTLIRWKQNPTCAMAITEKLVKAGALVIRMRDDQGWTALHFGAQYGDLHALQLLAAHATKCDPRNDALDTPLDLLCRRTGVDPACVDVLCQGSVTEDLLREAFYTACRHSDAPVVQRVLTRLDTLLGTSAPLVQSDFWACLVNQNHCSSLFTLLQDRFQWLTPTLDSDEFQAMLRHGDAVLAARFARYATKNPWVKTNESIAALQSRPNDTNFMPFLLAAQTAGWNITTAKIKSYLQDGPPNLLRALLQMGAHLEAGKRTNQTKTDVITRDKKLRQPHAGDTELHVAVRTGRLDAVENCFQRLLNPFMANYRGELPIQLAQDPTIRHALRIYMRTSVCHKTEKDVRVPPLDGRVVCWYGPYFKSVAAAFLRARHYHRKHGNPYISHNILPKILDYVAESLFPFYRE